MTATQECGTSSMSSSFDQGPVVGHSDNTSGHIVFDFGDLPWSTPAATMQLCWCSSNSSCRLDFPESFRAVAGHLHLVCPPGYYEGTSRSCVECTPGYFCQGGQAATAATRTVCSNGRTSPSKSTSAENCTCQEGRVPSLTIIGPGANGE